MDFTEQDIQYSLQMLQAGGMLLFPADYGWSLGCDATNDAAVLQLRQIVQQPDGHLPVLLAEERDVLQWVAAADLSVFDFVQEQKRPTAIVFEHGLGFADSLPAKDGSVLILLTQNPFCRHLVKRFRLPVVAVPCSLKEVKHLQESNTVINSLHIAELNLIAHRQSLACALQVVHWNNGQPVVQAYL